MALIAGPGAIFGQVGGTVCIMDFADKCIIRFNLIGLFKDIDGLACTYAKSCIQDKFKSDWVTSEYCGITEYGVLTW